MTPFEMGKIGAYLLKHRKVEEKSERRTIQREERDIAEILREAPGDSKRFLEEMMLGYGFELVTLTAFDVKGIAPGARVYLLVRSVNTECPLLDTGKMIEKMSGTERKAGASKIWFTQIWLMHLDLMYTAKDRSPHERNLWLDSGFTEEHLAHSMREHINGFVRKLNPQEVEQSEVYRILCAEKGADLPRYVNRFLSMMVEAGMLDEIGPGNYRQSLLSAVEMKESYDRFLAPLMLDLPVEKERAGIAHAAASLLTAKSSQELTEGSKS
jgi:hypothetical protein